MIPPSFQKINIANCPLFVPNSAQQELLSKRFSLYDQVTLKAALIFLSPATVALDRLYSEVYVWRDDATIHTEVQKKLGKN